MGNAATAKKGSEVESDVRESATMPVKLKGLSELKCFQNTVEVF